MIGTALFSCAMLVSSVCSAQRFVPSADSLRRLDSMTTAAQRAALFRLYHPQPAAKRTTTTIAVQLLAGEATWSVPFFAIHGNELFLKPVDLQGDGIGWAFGAAINQFACMVVTPLAIHAATALMGNETESLTTPYAVGYLSIFASMALWRATYNLHSPAISFLSLSLPVVGLTTLTYDSQHSDSR